MNLPPESFYITHYYIKQLAIINQKINSYSDKLLSKDDEKILADYHTQRQILKDVYLEKERNQSFHQSYADWYNGIKLDQRNVFHEISNKYYKENDISEMTLDDFISVITELIKTHFLMEIV